MTYTLPLKRIRNSTHKERHSSRIGTGEKGRAEIMKLRREKTRTRQIVFQTVKTTREVYWLKT